MRGAVATHGDEMAIALEVTFARERNGVTRSSRSDHIDGQPAFAQTRQSRPGEFRRAAATRGGIHDSKEAFHQGFVGITLLIGLLRRANTGGPLERPQTQKTGT